MTVSKIAILGSGVIGASWAIVYARSGCDVAIYERSETFRDSALQRIESSLASSASLLRDGETVQDVLARITLHDTLEAAVAGAEFVHECIVEKLDSKTQIFAALLENAASEQGARMSAMDNATRNAGEMIDKLTIEYNRSRQAVITNELIEIISGAEAL